MVLLATSLKRSHCLKGIGLLPVAVIKRMRSGRSDSLKEFARMQRNSKTEDLNMEEIYRNITTITGESLTEVLQEADQAETIEVAIRLALHCITLYHIVSHYIILYHIVSYFITLYHIVSYCITLHHIVCQ